MLDDGTAGLMAIKRRGGATLVQAPAEALYDTMPKTAIELVHPDVIAGVAELAAEMTRLATAPPPDRPMPASADPREDAVLAVDRGGSDDPQPGRPMGLTCPECNGAIWESVEDGIVRFRCRTGHEYALETFVAEQSERVEAALWTALRTLEERAALNRRIAARNRERGNAKTADRFALRADEAIEHAIVLRRVLAEYENVGVNEEGVA